MNEMMKEILLKQVELLQKACERDMMPDEAARLSEALSNAISIAASYTLGCGFINGPLR